MPKPPIINEENNSINNNLTSNNPQTNISFESLDKTVNDMKSKEFSAVWDSEKKNIIADESGKYSKKDYLGESLGQQTSDNFVSELSLHTGKNTIGTIAQEYLEHAKSYQLIYLLKKVQEYSQFTNTRSDAKIDADTYKNDLDNEVYFEGHLTLNNIISDAEKLYDSLSDEYLKASVKEVPVEENGETVYKSFETRDINEISGELKMVSGIMTYFDSLKYGELVVNDDEVIDYSKTEIKSGKLGDGNMPIPADMPLFSHEPTPDDIIQGGLGDCYFMAGLASMARNNPQSIKDAIRDNGDGTCTVRFFNRVASPKGPGHDDSFEPVYIKVNKEIPINGAAYKAAPWVAIMERAYVASGMHIDDNDMYIHNYERYNKAQDFTKLYNDLKKKDRSDWPSHMECPALIDEKGNLHEYKPSYKQIAGGKAANVIEAIGGSNYQCTTQGTAVSYNDLARSYVNDFFSKLYKNSGVKLPEPQNTRYLSDNEKLFSPDFAQMLYCFVTKQQPPLDPVTKQIDKNNRLLSLINTMSVAFTRGAMTAAKAKWDKNSKVTADSFSGLLLKNFDMELSRAIEQNPALKDFRKNNLQMFNSYKSMITRNLYSIDAQKYAPKERHSGQYNVAQEKLFNDISKYVKDGTSRNITTGTNSAPDGVTGDNFGLQYGHEYTVEGVTTKNLGGKDYKFVIIRNPYASNKGRTYEYNDATGKIEPKEAETENGISYVELSDFEDLVDFGINKEKEYQPENKIQTLDLSTVSKYSRIMESLENNLTQRMKPGDLPMYTDLVKEIKTLRTKIDDSFGKPITDMRKIMSGVSNAANRYINYCNMNKSNGLVEDEERLRVAETAGSFVNTVIDSCNKGNINKDPKETLKNLMAEHAVDVMHKIGMLQFEEKDRANAIESYKQSMKGDYCSMVLETDKLMDECARIEKLNKEQALNLSNGNVSKEKAIN